MAECTKCIHNAVCKTAESCDGYVSGCEHFNEGWISVKDRLPSANGKYLCNIFDSSLNNLSFMAMVYYDRGNFISQSTCVTDCVTHWMPLPQPPKGE